MHCGLSRSAEPSAQDLRRKGYPLTLDEALEGWPTSLSVFRSRGAGVRCRRSRSPCNPAAERLDLTLGGFELIDQVLLFYRQPAIAMSCLAVALKRPIGLAPTHPRTRS